ncbi:MAG TPA: Xaa-Pro peptidase family protein [Armatimonadota bacterium]|jgi:Xaa-Pro aminopeptidase
MAIAIPNDEFAARISRVQQTLREQNLDALLVHSHEADFANVRYLSNYWPIFETAGVLIPAEGEAALIIGPESMTFARDRSKLPMIRRILEYRESADPEYPGVELDTFGSILKEMGVTPNRLGLCGASLMPVTVYQALLRDVPAENIVKADDVVVDLRIIKSEAELACLREAFRISEVALQAVLAEIRPGMTELQVVGLAQRALYENGAEYEGHPVYVLSGIASTHAIGRPSHRVLERGDYVQLNIGARVSGYSSSLGLPLCLGPMTEDMRRLTEVGLEAHYKTMEWMKAGVIANEVVFKFEEFVKAAGCGENLLYGPCHGLGMMEVERPWMESISTYPLQENMTFQVDTFLYAPTFGLRWENGVRVTATGVEKLASPKFEVLELDF